jgi:hypothetical protein
MTDWLERWGNELLLVLAIIFIVFPLILMGTQIGMNFVNDTNSFHIGEVVCQKISGFKGVIVDVRWIPQIEKVNAPFVVRFYNPSRYDTQTTGFYIAEELLHESECGKND